MRAQTTQAGAPRYGIHPGVNTTCTECSGISYVVQRKNEAAVAQRCSCVTICPLCKDSGFVAKQGEKRAPLVRCRCHTAQRALDRFNRVLVPARMADKTLSNFLFSEVSTNVVRSVSHYLKHFDLNGMSRGLVLYGSVGRGKTHLLTAMLRSLVLEHGVSARFVEFSHLLADLKSSFGRGGGANNLIEPLVRVDVLGIDELGKGRNTAFEGTVLDELISRRYNAGRTIIATTNYEPGPSSGLSVPDLALNKRPALVDRIGDRVYSRLNEMCDMIPVQGCDYRQKIAEQKGS